MIFIMPLLATSIMSFMLIWKIHEEYDMDLHAFNSFEGSYKKIILTDCIRRSSVIWKAAMALMAIAAVPVVALISVYYYLKTMVTVLWETKD